MDEMDQLSDSYDVVVVGGGAAGLSAALTLGRARRSVVVLDDGSPRNSAADHVHNYLGRDGVAPGALLSEGRNEVRGYGGRVVVGHAVTARRLPPTEPGALKAGAAFELGLHDGRPVQARRLLLATGLRDELPGLPGISARWGRDVINCPFCHGWEFRDQKLAVLDGSGFGGQQALLFRQWSSDITLLSHTAPTPTGALREQLDARGVQVVEGEVEQLVVEDDRLTAVTLHSGRSVPVDALGITPFLRARGLLLDQLGLESVPKRMGDLVFATHVAAGPTGATTVPGLWVAGNLADPLAQVVSSAAAGLNAAAAINADLGAEDTAVAVARLRARRAA